MPNTELRPEEVKPPELMRAATEGITIVKIGAGERVYYLHRALLTYHSESFRPALTGPWKEAEEGVVTLHDIETSTFNVFVHWLYTQRLPNKQEWASVTEIDSLNPNDKDEQALLLFLYVKAYALGDLFVCSAFCSKVEHDLHRDYWSGRSPYREAVYCQAIAYAFANISRGHEILDELVEGYSDCWVRTEEWDEEARNDHFGIEVQEKLPSAFLARVMQHRVKAHKAETIGALQWFGVNELLH